MMHPKLLLIILLFTTIMHVSVLGQGELEERIEQAWTTLLGQEAMHGASVGFCLVDKEGGHQIYGKNEHLQLTPASTLKAVVCLTTLELFGSDYTFKTELIVRGTVSKGVLKGDIIIRGYGDPAFGSPYWERHYGDVFERMTTAVKQAGISTIEGDILVDNSYFEHDWLPGSTAYEDVGNYYGAEAHGFNVLDNTYQLYLNSGDVGSQLEVVKTVPEMASLEFKVDAIAGSTKSDNAYIYGLPFSRERVVRGEIPANRTNFVIKGSMPDPAEWMAHRMVEALREKNFLVFGEARSELNLEPSPDEKVILTIESPSVAQLVPFTMSKSMNLYANVFLKHIGLKQSGFGTYEAGGKAVKAYWTSKGIDTKGMHVVDGSGLSRLNTISAAQMTRIIGSVTGINEEIMGRSFNKISGSSSIKAKSGYLGGVRAFTGIIKLFNGEEAYFTIISNHHAGSPTETRIALQKFLKAMV